MSAPANHDTELAALEQLAKARGKSVDEIRVLLGESSAPVVSEHMAAYLSRQTPRTRSTYATHLNRARNGIGPICDQTCEPCLTSADFACSCDCAKCVPSRITIAPIGQLRVSSSVYSEELTKNLRAVATRHAIKKGILDNRRRAALGKPAKRADGHNAGETAVGAARSLFNDALKHCGDINSALQVPKPSRDPKERRPLKHFELVEVHHYTATSGNDPELDTLIIDLGIATGARSEGVSLLTMSSLHLETQMIDIFDKGKKRTPMPVSRDLLERLFAHALKRGGPACDPTSLHYIPDSAVLYTRRANTTAPVTGRRIDGIIERWQKELSWARDEQLVFHHLRHTVGAHLEMNYGPQFKRRYLRHKEKTVTDGYGKCSNDSFARAMSELLGFEHPLVHGIEQREQDTLRRFGLS